MLNKNLCVVQIVLIMFIRPTETVVAMRTVDKSCEIWIVWVILHHKLLFVAKCLNIKFNQNWAKTFLYIIRIFSLFFSFSLKMSIGDSASDWQTRTFYSQLLLHLSPQTLTHLKKVFWQNKNWHCKINSYKDL